MIRSKRIALTSGLVALALVAGALLSSGRQPLSSPPAELAAFVPSDPQQLGQWCVDRQAQGTAGLSRGARNWLEDCVELFGAGIVPGSPTPAPSATQTASPSSSPTVQPSPTVSPTATTPPATTIPASPTPSPTTPSPTGLLTNCFDRLAACGYPTTTSTGVPAGTVLTAYTGPLTISTTVTITGKSIGCGLTIRSGGNVTIRNSKITGPCFYGVDMEGGTLLIEDSEVDCIDHRGTGIAYTNFTARRVLVRNCENGFHVGSNTLVEDSYITGVAEVGGGHGDGIQGQSGSNIVIRHTTFDLTNPITSSIIWDRLTMNNVTVENNFFAAGAYTVYVPTSGSNIAYRNNRFFGPVGGSTTHRPAYGFSTGAGRSGVTWVGNYRDDTLGAVNAA